MSATLIIIPNSGMAPLPREPADLIVVLVKSDWGFRASLGVFYLPNVEEPFAQYIQELKTLLHSGRFTRVYFSVTHVHDPAQDTQNILQDRALEELAEVGEIAEPISLVSNWACRHIWPSGVALEMATNPLATHAHCAVTRKCFALAKQ